jgi:hypothetical protein
MPNAGSKLAFSVLAAYTDGAAPANSPPEWFAVAFPVFFIGMWILVTTLLGWIGGHMALLARFPPVEEPKETVFRWASGAMRAGVSFNNALYVGLGTRGLHLAPNALFRPIFRRGVPCIPWQEIRLVRPQPAGIAAWFKGSKFEIPAAGVRFALAGAAGRAVERKLSTGKPSTEPPRSQLVRER